MDLSEHWLVTRRDGSTWVEHDPARAAALRADPSCEVSGPFVLEQQPRGAVDPGEVDRLREELDESEQIAARFKASADELSDQLERLRDLLRLARQYVSKHDKVGNDLAKVDAVLFEQNGT
jgi:uncharacterized membrane protein YccC